MLNDIIEQADAEAEDIQKAHYRITVTEAVITGLEVIHGTAEGVRLFDLSRMSEKALLAHAQRTGIMSGAARAGIAPRAVRCTRAIQ